MRLPTVQGVIERRLLVNFRCDPEVVGRILPAPFEPITVRGQSLVGICLIRLSGVRPAFVPSRCGIRSENAAHRIAVKWECAGVQGEGVYIPRRDSSSRFNALVGGRLFPGVHNAAELRVVEESGGYDIEMNSRDGGGSLHVRGRASSEWPMGSVFANLEEASAFFRRGSLGYSITRRPGTYDGLELVCREWLMQPIQVESVRSSFFDDTRKFPKGSIQFDCALVMRNIAHEWHGRGQMCCECEAPTAAAA